MQQIVPIAANNEQIATDTIGRAREILIRRRWWFIFSAVLTMAATVMFTRHQPRVYRAIGTIYIAKRAPRVLSNVREVVDLGAGGFWQSKQYYQAQVEIIRSRELAQMVVDRLGLATNEHFHGLDNAKLELTDQQKRDRMMNADSASKLAARVGVMLGKTAMIARISIEDTDPAFAKDLVNELMNAYKDRNLQTRGNTTRKANRDLRELLKDMQAKKETSEKALYEFETKHDLSKNRQLAVNERILALERAHRTVRSSRFRAQQRMKSMRRMKNAGSVFDLGYDSLMADSLLGALKQRKVDISVKKRALSTTYLDRHPKVMEVKDEERLVDKIAKRHVSALYRAAAIAFKNSIAEEREIERQLVSAREEDRRIRARQSEYTRLLAKRDEDKAFYDMVARRLTETGLSGQVEFNNVSVLDEAVLPKIPVRPDVRLNYLAGFLLSVLVGLGTALGVNMLDNSIKGRYEVEEVLKMPYLGAIPKFDPETVEAGVEQEPMNIDLYAHHRPNSRVAEASRTLRTNILFMRPDKPIRTLLVSSALPREGKTATSTTLSIALAAANGSCILVDTDLRKPRLHKVFGLQSDVGVTNYVLTGQPVENFVKKTEVPGLDLLACGPLPPNSSEIMHTQRFRDLVVELSEKYETVVFDSSPVEIVSDALVLATLVDGALLVAHANVSKIDLVGNAARGIRGVNANLLGCVLSRTETTGSGYGYYYGRGYRKGGRPYRYRYAADQDDDTPRMAG